ncbi:hypothetical protein [Paenibacillus mucilaginosus]|uniref:Secreted protein n=2 Tax=Paenibacillus mucilaginosus TaxID=61624 RepID=H6NA85_9BACL|nr:hypothetical protein [Paenibacillus mucilaginosus]AEI40721.1 hypothetical protein KNP414_02160 [Paenibacillus mucilaginosus KNP414]AFC29331.1 hypothetical protein PM3016_2443 [Paenibacillus mucilaginosus 3016]MCG7211796.1 hypothetical protein [Paenibacillus mucilaginosus]WDM29854.1 hypothetical protein KCX80_12205 [Paenibacillus mucilaginosus]WFA18048.1 hypothetical protein ERY13_12575 [Paenibacillus mucilaginosus]
MMKRIAVLAALSAVLLAGSVSAAPSVEKPGGGPKGTPAEHVNQAGFVDDDADDDAPGAQGGHKAKAEEPKPPKIETNAPAVDLTAPGVQWLDQLKPVQPGDTAALGDGYCACTMVTVKLKRISVRGNNESGTDEWRFRVKLGSQTFYYPSSTGQYNISSSATYPHDIYLDYVLHDSKYYLTDGQTVGMIFDVEARELDTFSDDVSRASGALGITIPTSGTWYSITAQNDTPVLFQFEISTRPASKYD